jgi:hypothetical protein
MSLDFVSLSFPHNRRSFQSASENMLKNLTREELIEKEAVKGNACVADCRSCEIEI